MMTRIEVDRIKEEYPPGSHVKLIEMKGEPQMPYGLKHICIQSTLAEDPCHEIILVLKMIIECRALDFSRPAYFSYYDLIQ